MKNIDKIKERYLKETFDRRLGHLASDLARISSFSEKNIDVIKDLIEESKFFIEWTAPDATFDVQVMLCEIQLGLAIWQRRLLQVREIKELRSAANRWSDRLLLASGLLAA